MHHMHFPMLAVIKCDTENNSGLSCGMLFVAVAIVLPHCSRQFSKAGIISSWEI